MSEPITAIGVVASLSRVPSHYTAVKWTKDTHDEADLGKENILRKSPRFIVFEKKPCSKSSPHEVLVELTVVTGKDVVPPDFIVIDKTLDTREKCFKGKYLCARFETWRPYITAITDVVVFKNSRDGIQGHTIVGELADQRTLACVQSSVGGEETPRKKVPERPVYTLKKPIVYNPMSGVPFNCHANESVNSVNDSTFRPKTREVLEAEYNFDFSLERSIAAQRG